MYQLNPASLDSTEYKLDNTIYKNKTLKNKNVKFDLENVNRNSFNYNYTANNKINNNTSDKKIKNLSNLISKLHNKTEQDEDLEVDYVNYKDLYHTKDKFLDDTNIYSNSKELDFNNSISDNTVIHDNNNNKNSYNIQDNINEDTDLMNYNKNYNTINYSNVDYKKMIEFNNRILTKIDNILNILEEQKMVKTKHITEELILYLFLGIFIIYILDSFVKVSKYTR
jgi:membrane-associated HD superfamily phosphohydrolase